MDAYDMMSHEQASTLMLVEPLIATGKAETGCGGSRILKEGV